MECEGWNLVNVYIINVSIITILGYCADYNFLDMAVNMPHILSLLYFIIVFHYCILSKSLNLYNACSHPRKGTVTLTFDVITPKLIGLFHWSLATCPPTLKTTVLQLLIGNCVVY